MESNHQNVAFLSDEIWLKDWAILTDITQHLSELKLRQQGKRKLENNLFGHICSLEKKLNCFRFSWVEPCWPISRVWQPGRWNFLIFIPQTMQQVFKSHAMSSQTGFQSSDEMRLRKSCLLIHLIWQWKTVLSMLNRSHWTASWHRHQEGIF